MEDGIKQRNLFATLTSETLNASQVHFILIVSNMLIHTVKTEEMCTNCRHQKEFTHGGFPKIKALRGTWID